MGFFLKKMSYSAKNNPEFLRDFYRKLIHFREFCFNNFNSILEETDKIKEKWKDEQYVYFVDRINTQFINSLNFSIETNAALNSIQMDLLLIEEFAEVQNRIKQSWFNNDPSHTNLKDVAINIQRGNIFENLLHIAKNLFLKTQIDSNEIELDIFKETLLAAQIFKNISLFKVVPISISTQSLSHGIKELKKEIAIITDHLNSFSTTNRIGTEKEKELINALYLKQLELHEYENNCYAFYYNREVTLIKNYYIDVVNYHHCLKKNEYEKFHPCNCASVKSVLFHELGHFCVEHLLSSKYFAKFQSIVIELQNSLIGRYIPNFTLNELSYFEREMIKEKVSEYASFSQDELIAEIISEYLTQLEESRAISKLFGKKILNLIAKLNKEIGDA